MGESELLGLREEMAQLRQLVSRLVAQQTERPRLYEFQAAARLLSVDPRTVSRMVQTGELLTVQVRGKRLIPATEIDRVATPLPTAPKSSGATPERVKYDAKAALARLRELRAKR